MIKVFICDDQDIVCDGLKVILSSDPEIQVVGMAYDGLEALEKIPQTHPNLVLMDLKMPRMNGVEATQQIHRQYPEIRILVLTTYDADEWVFDAIRSGAAGYLLKDTPREGLITAVKGTVQGQTHVAPGVAGKLFHFIQGQTAPTTLMLEHLNEREKELLQLIGRGLNNAEIAAQLHLSHGTVRNYVSALLEKLNLTDRTQAALLALRCGLIE